MTTLGIQFMSLMVPQRTKGLAKVCACKATQGKCKTEKWVMVTYKTPGLITVKRSGRLCWHKAEALCVSLATVEPDEAILVKTCKFGPDLRIIRKLCTVPFAEPHMGQVLTMKSEEENPTTKEAVKESRTALEEIGLNDAPKHLHQQIKDVPAKHGRMRDGTLEVIHAVEHVSCGKIVGDQNHWISLHVFLYFNTCLKCSKCKQMLASQTPKKGSQNGADINDRTVEGSELIVSRTSRPQLGLLLSLSQVFIALHFPRLCRPSRSGESLLASCTCFSTLTRQVAEAGIKENRRARHEAIVLNTLWCFGSWKEPVSPDGGSARGLCIWDGSGRTCPRREQGAPHGATGNSCSDHVFPSQ